MHNVLIIDDDKLAREGLRSIIYWEKYNLKVVGDVANGIQALEFLKQNQVDLAIVDISLPLISGFEFIELSKKQFPLLKYVVLSFHEDFENVHNAMQYGVLDYISKLRLEETDCEKTFSRIGKLLDSNAGSDAEISIDSDMTDEDGLSAEELSTIRAVWEKLQWVYSDRVYFRAIEEIRKSNISKRQLERLLMWISQELEIAFDFIRDVPFLNEKSDGFDWIEECRKYLYYYVDKLTEYRNMKVCILRSVIFIKNNFSSQITSEGVAQAVNMSRSYFSINFRQETGDTFYDFLKNERIDHAMRILQTNRIRTEDLALLVGYEDPKYFSKVFLQETGMNCSAYAKQFSP
jgi:two-component system, response regulator YesN